MRYDNDSLSSSDVCCVLSESGDDTFLLDKKEEKVIKVVQSFDSGEETCGGDTLLNKKEEKIIKVVQSVGSGEETFDGDTFLDKKEEEIIKVVQKETCSGEETFDGHRPVLIIRALTNIKIGEELTHNYISVCVILCLSS